MDYVFSGKPVDGAAEAEHKAKPGEILVDPNFEKNLKDNFFDGFKKIMEEED